MASIIVFWFATKCRGVLKHKGKKIMSPFQCLITLPVVGKHWRGACEVAEKQLSQTFLFFLNFSDSKKQMCDSTKVSAGQTYKRQLPFVTRTITYGHFYLIWHPRSEGSIPSITCLVRDGPFKCLPLNSGSNSLRFHGDTRGNAWHASLPCGLPCCCMEC